MSTWERGSAPNDMFSGGIRQHGFMATQTCSQSRSMPAGGEMNEHSYARTHTHTRRHMNVRTLTCTAVHTHIRAHTGTLKYTYCSYPNTHSQTLEVPNIILSLPVCLPLSFSNDYANRLPSLNPSIYVTHRSESLKALKALD